MSKGLFIGLGSVIFLAVIGGLALFNTWQIANFEERLVKVHQTVDGLREMEGKIDFIKRQLKDLKSGGIMVAGGSSSSSGVGAEASGGGACPGNLLLADPDKWLPEEARYGGALSRSLIAGAKGYNPITENGADVSEIWTYVGGGLATRHKNNPDLWGPELAWCITMQELPALTKGGDERVVYTVKIREGVNWHPIQDEYLEKGDWLKGDHPLTVDDFIFALEMIRDPAVEGAAPTRTYIQDLEKIEKVDDFTMTVHWKRKVFLSKSVTYTWAPAAKWLYSKDPDGKPYDKEVIGQNFNQHWYRHMMGMGPYRFHSFGENEYVKLVKSTTFFGDEPSFDEIVFNVVKDSTQRKAQLDSGGLDYINIEPAQYQNEIISAGSKSQFVEPDAEGNVPKGKFGYQVFNRMVYRYLGWDGDGVFFGPKGQSVDEARKVRRAMTHALNRPEIVEQIFSNLGQVVTGNFYPLSPEYDQSIKPYEYNLDEARRLLDEAGWKDTDANGIRDKNGVDFRFTMLVYSYRPEFISMAEYYKEDLKKIGVDLTVSPVDWPTMQTKMNDKQFDAYTGGWALGWESDPYQIWHSSQADVPEGSNRVGFRNKRADEIIDKARVTFDTAKRIELFHEFHKIVHEEQPYTFFFAQKGVGAWQPHMKNMVFQKIRPHDIAFPWYTSEP